MAYSDTFLVKSLSEDVPTTKGTEIMEAMLLDQYKESTNLKEYYKAFIAEMDILFEEISKVYLGRTLEYATGYQLDVIGRILQQERTIELPRLYFGFSGATGVAGMADESALSFGGVFLGENSLGFVVTPLDDITYRKVLRVKALVGMKSQGNRPEVDEVYNLITILIGKVPKTFQLEELADRVLQLTVASNEIGPADLQLIDYMSRYFTPLGAKFTIIQV